MRTLTEKQMADYIESFIERKYGRLLGNRFFQGTVASVTTGVPFQITLIRTGESKVDGNVYPVLSSAYIPQLGDRVECMWRDNNTAYCMGLVGGTGFGSTNLANPSVVALGTAFGSQQLGIGGVLTTITGCVIDFVPPLNLNRKLRVSWGLSLDLGGTAVLGDELQVTVLVTRKNNSSPGFVKQIVLPKLRPSSYELDGFSIYDFSSISPVKQVSLAVNVATGTGNINSYVENGLPVIEVEDLGPFP